eukprot:COSAG01_NODE_549_length_15608_cov_206.443355_6_plen_200_part_00
MTLNAAEFTGGLFFTNFSEGETAPSAGGGGHRVGLGALENGDLVVHQYDLLHGVQTSSGQRFSLIFWFTGSGGSCDRGTSDSPWYEREARRGNADAALRLWHRNMGTDDRRNAQLQDMSDAERERATQRNLKWLKLAVEGGQAEAMGIYASVLIGTDDAEAMKWMARAAELGRRDAMAMYGHFLLEGGDPSKRAEGMRW